MQTKACNGCGKEKPLSEYHKNRSSPDGLQTWCKACKSALRRRYYHENKASAQDYNRQWERENRDRRRAIAKRYRRNNPDAMRRWRERHPRVSRIRDAARRAVRTEVEAGRLEHPTNKRCVVCGEGASHYHHHKGYAEENRLKVVPMCASCHKHEHLQGER